MPARDVIARVWRRPPQTSRWRVVAGPVVTVVLVIVLELLDHTPYRPPSPTIVMLIAVVFSAYLGGVTAGLLSAVITIAYGFHENILPGEPLHAGSPGLWRMLVLLVAAPAIAAMVGILQRRDRERAVETARAEALERYRDLVQELDGIVWERDTETLAITFVSRRAWDVLGYPTDQWLEEPDFWALHVHPDDRELAVEGVREAARLGTARVLEYRIHAADGRDVWVRDAMRVLPERMGGRRFGGVMMDVTPLMRTEQALRASEAHKAEILASSLDGIVEVDEHGRITDFNPAAAEIFGHSRKQAVGQDLAELIVPPSQRQAHRSGMKRYLETGHPRMLGRRMEMTALRADGQEFPVELTVIATARGGRPSFTGFVRDLTKRYEAERSLREAERNYRLLMGDTSDGILITDLSAKFLDVNARICEMLGYSHEELVGMRFADLVPAEDLSRLPLRLEELRAGLPVLVERLLRRKDGTLLPIEISAKRLDEDRLLGLIRDVTERKRAEQELHTTMSLLTATLESTADGILVVDLQGRIARFNRRFVEMWRIPEEIIASRDDDRAIAYVLDQLKDPKGFVAKVRELYGQPDAESFDVLEFKDGRIFERYSLPQRVAGVSVGRVWSFRDVSERRRAERALHESEEQLRQAQKMEALGRVAGGVAHDFNNILTVILGNSGLMLEGLSPGTSAHHSASEIHAAAERAASLTRQLLAFSRRQMLEVHVVDLNLVVADMHKMLGRLIGEHVKLEIELGHDLGAIKVDPGQLQQVLLNLALNARDAMPDGGQLTIVTDTLDIADEYSAPNPDVQPGRYVVLQVEDTGVGMSADTMAHIFEPFFTTKERGKGTGLGLATSYGVVRQSGGHILVDSAVGRGTTFRILLPRVDESPTDGELAVAPAGKSRGSETVLVVEDEPMVRTLISQSLLERGYRVLDAENGSQAITIASRHVGTIDLLVTDVVMPGMSGHELADHLSHRRPDTKVLYISGYSDQAPIPGAGDAGSGFLQKPFTLETLALKVREVLDGAIAT